MAPHLADWKWSEGEGGTYYLRFKDRQEVFGSAAGKTAAENEHYRMLQSDFDRANGLVWG